MSNFLAVGTTGICLDRETTVIIGSTRHAKAPAGTRVTPAQDRIAASEF
jgi:hypothetical protein